MSFFSFRNKQRARKNEETAIQSFHVEGLEDRRMLTSVTLSGGELEVRGSSGHDTIRLIGSQDHQSFNVQINNTVNQSFSRAAVNKITVYAGGGNDTVINTLLDPTTIFGQNGHDTIQGGFNDDIIHGGNGNDDIFGRNGDDTLNGNAGADTLRGVNGNDRLNGGTGNDMLYGGNGNDRIYGQGDADTIYGDAGNDVIIGGNGNDRIYGNNGNDRISGNAGADRIFGGAGNDVVNAGTGDDVVLGEAGNDFLRGNGGDDFLFGQEGTDRLFGDGGNDTIDAGFDNVTDYLTGGAGNDRFVVLHGRLDLKDIATDRTGGEQVLADLSGDGPDDPDVPCDGLCEIVESAKEIVEELKTVLENLSIDSQSIEEACDIIGFLDDLIGILQSDVSDFSDAVSLVNQINSSLEFLDENLPNSPGISAPLQSFAQIFSTIESGIDLLNDPLGSLF